MTAEKHHEEPAMEQPVEVKVEEAKPSAKKSSATLRNFVLGGLLAVLVLAIGAFAILAAGIYKLGWKGPVASQVVHALPLPVATVNSNPILYADYLDDVDTLKHFYSKQTAQVEAQGGTVPSDQEINQNVIDRLVRNEVLKEEAVKYNVTVTDEDVKAEFDKLIAQAGKEETVRNDINELYGWTVDEFKEKVLTPYLLEQKLGEAISKDAALNADAEAKANEVLGKVQAGEDFAELAKANSADYVSGQNGGDLGWFERGVMVKEFEDAAFSMKKGEVSGIVRTNFGFHIIKVTDVEEKDGAVVKVKASHILIPGTTVEEYIQKKVDEAKVKMLVELDTPPATNTNEPKQ